MLKDWTKLLNTDCLVVGIGNHIVYPIFRNGSTSLLQACDRQYINEDIKMCENVQILIRDPADRFVSGINAYCKQNNLVVEEIWSEVYKGNLIDRHFSPQYVWLLHLYKFYKGKVTLRNFEYIKKITSIRTKKNAPRKIKVPQIENFIEIDKKLLLLIDKPVYLKDIIQGYKNVLS